MSLRLAGGGRELVELEPIWNLAATHVPAGGRRGARPVDAGACRGCRCRCREVVMTELQQRSYRSSSCCCVLSPLIPCSGDWGDAGGPVLCRPSDAISTPHEDWLDHPGRVYIHTIARIDDKAWTVVHVLTRPCDLKNMSGSA